MIQKNSTCANTDNKINRFVTSFALAPTLKSTLYLDGKTCAIPSLHRDNFLAKVPGSCPVLRQVTPTNFIAGPLVAKIALFNLEIKPLTLIPLAP